MKFVKILMVPVAISMTGCVGGLDNACIQTMPVVAKGNVLINGAQDALVQAEVAFDAIKDDNVRAKAMKALLEARSALRVSESLLHAATEACSEPNLKGVFQAFSEAWEIVRTYLSSFGGAAGVAEVKDPIAYTVGKVE